MDDVKIDLDLGDGHTLTFTSWHPDRELNPQYADLPDIEKCGAIVGHPRADGKEGRCWSGIYFDSEAVRRVFGDKQIWQVNSWEPLTLSPSLLCRECGDHGFIREGKWIRA
jgi:hypothetical protein